jgi:hypothetical protein
MLDLTFFTCTYLSLGPQYLTGTFVPSGYAWLPLGVSCLNISTVHAGSLVKYLSRRPSGRPSRRPRGFNGEKDVGCRQAKGSCIMAVNARNHFEFFGQRLTNSTPNLCAVMQCCIILVESSKPPPSTLLQNNLVTFCFNALSVSPNLTDIYIKGVEGFKLDPGPTGGSFCPPHFQGGLPIGLVLAR